ncbi:hypothetical protein PIB30_020174 [Stylosanthes scabra]|uniref:Uncharacterized protein n=1 Tax=Stylosanthes scabra TaxID=79078 RepID=A0ABU6Q8E1_9FABA|nr:hypothetical protein [Stylosanthes scabra]
MANPSVGHTCDQRSQDKEEDEEVIKFHDDIWEGLEKCSKSLIGRLLVDCQFNAETLEAALYSIWRQLEGFKVMNHGSFRVSLFGFSYGRLWSIAKLKAWEGGVVLEEVLDIDIFIVQSKEERILKVQVQLDITKSLKRALRF